METNPILYIVLNGELKMSAGKAAAQAVHAAMSLENKSNICVNGSFASHNTRTVIILKAKNTDQIRNLKEYLTGAGISSTYYIDEGVNEVRAYSITALAVEPFDSDDEEKRAIFAPFDLFNIYQDEPSCNKVVERNEPNEREIMLSWLEHSIKYKNAPWYVRKAYKWMKDR